MLTQIQFGWRIKTLVCNLTKKNLVQTQAELENILKMYTASGSTAGNNAADRAPVISALLDEINFTDLRTIGPKDEHKVSSLLIKKITSISFQFLTTIYRISFFISLFLYLFSKFSKFSKFSFYFHFHCFCS